MTMILATHLGDHILIASDNRSMSCDIETGEMRLSHDNEVKLKAWCRGAVTGTGEKVFLDRVTDYFIQLDIDDLKLKQMDAVHEEVIRRLNEGIPQEMLFNNTVIFSLFDGIETQLFSIPTNQFFEIYMKNGVEMVNLSMRKISAWQISLNCFNITPDIAYLQEFQRSLKHRSEFENFSSFVSYYIDQLKKVFAHQSSIDPSVTASFDVFFQSCRTGESIAFHIDNPLLGMPIPQDLNYWDRF